MMSTFSRLGLRILVRRHHDAEIDDLVIVALEHDADDVLADVVDVALDRRHQRSCRRSCGVRHCPPLASVGCFSASMKRHQIGHRLLHHAGRLHHLRQEHLAGAEQVADDVHAGHQRAFDDMQRTLSP
jgi:hypothetical protein